MISSEQGIVQHDCAKDQQRQPDGDLICHEGPEQKRPPR